MQVRSTGWPRRSTATIRRRRRRRRAAARPLAVLPARRAPVRASARTAMPKRGGFLPPVHRTAAPHVGGQPPRLSGEIRVGDAIVRRSAIESVRAKEGAGGPLVFVTVRHEIGRAGRAAAIVDEHDIVYRGPGRRRRRSRRRRRPSRRMAARAGARRRAALPLFGAHLQRPPHPLRPRLRRRGKRAIPGSSCTAR